MSAQSVYDAETPRFVIALWNAGYRDLADEHLASERATANGELALSLDMLSAHMRARAAFDAPSIARCRELLMEAGRCFGDLAKVHTNADAAGAALVACAALQCAAEALVPEDPTAADALLDATREEIEAASEKAPAAADPARKLRFLAARSAYLRHRATARTQRSDAFWAVAHQALAAFGAEHSGTRSPWLMIEAWRLEADLLAEVGKTVDAHEYLDAACDRLREDLPELLANEAARRWAAGIFLQRARLQAAGEEANDVREPLADLEKAGLFRGVADLDLLVAEIEAKAGRDHTALVEAAQVARSPGSTGERAAALVFEIVARTSDLEGLPPEVLGAAGQVAFARKGEDARALAIRISDAVIASPAASPALAGEAHYRKGVCLWARGDRAAAAAAFDAAYEGLRNGNPAMRTTARRAWLAALRALVKDAPEDAARQSAYRAACTLAGEAPW